MKAAPIESDDYNNNNKNLSPKDNVPYGIDFASSPHYDPAYYDWYKVDQSILLGAAAVRNKETESPKMDKKSVKIPTSH